MASPHRQKSAESREFAEGGRVPTISLDHCFLGSAEEAAAANPFLIVYDDFSGAIFAIALASKEYEDWIAEYVKSIIEEIGYGGARVAMKHDNAPELIRL